MEESNKTQRLPVVGERWNTRRVRNCHAVILNVDSRRDYVRYRWYTRDIELHDMQYDGELTFECNILKFYDQFIYETQDEV